MQTFTFYASDDKLENRGNKAQAKHSGAKINEAACDLAREVASEYGGLTAGGICQTPTYLSGIGKAAVQEQLKKQLEVFVTNDVDFLICEYFEHIEEMEWAIEVALATGKPVAATMCIGPEGDMHGVSAGECGVRMAKAGANIVGINCHFDPDTVLAGLKKMKEALDAEGLKPYLMSQPLGYHTPDAAKQGFIDLPEFPFGLEPRILTRWEMHRYARQAWELGVRYIGGCCGFEPYHIRAVAEELAAERGNKMPVASEKHDMWGGGLKMHTKPWVRARARKDYWENLVPATGHPFSATLSRPDNWGVTAGDSSLKQQAKETSEEEIKQLTERQK